MTAATTIAIAAFVTVTNNMTRPYTFGEKTRLIPGKATRVDHPADLVELQRNPVIRGRIQAGDLTVVGDLDGLPSAPMSVSDQTAAVAEIDRQADMIADLNRQKADLEALVAKANADKATAEAAQAKAEADAKAAEEAKAKAEADAAAAAKAADKSGKEK